MRALKIAASAIGAVIVIIALLAVLGIPSDFLTSAIQARVERDTGYRLTVTGASRIGLWPSLHVTFNDVTLQNADDRDGTGRLTVARLQADMTLASVWSGRPHITDLVLVTPVLHVPLLRHRASPLNPPPRPATTIGEPEPNTPLIERVSISEGAVEFSHQRDGVTNRIEGINASAVIDGERKIKASGNARSGVQPLKFELDANAPARLGERQNIPVELKLEAPSALPAPLSAKAEVRFNSAVLMINGLSGRLG